MVEVEIAVQDLAGVQAAQSAGADRVELCVGLVTGGLTPPAGLLAAAVGTGLAVHALVRNRTGGFVHDPDELDALVREVRAAVDAGAAGVVVGALHPDGDVDEPALRALVDAAGDAQVTFHRAFDVVPDRPRALDRLAALGVARVLTSGGAPAAPAGLAALAELVRHGRATGGRVEIMAGGGVRVADVAALVATGVDAVHLSARRPGDDRGRAGPGGGAPGFDVTDADVVRAAVAQAAAVARSAEAPRDGRTP